MSLQMQLQEAALSCIEQAFKKITLTHLKKITGQWGFSKLDHNFINSQNSSN